MCEKLIVKHTRKRVVGGIRGHPLNEQHFVPQKAKNREKRSSSGKPARIAKQSAANGGGPFYLGLVCGHKMRISQEI